MQVLVFDSGFLLSLAADGDYSLAARAHWEQTEFWVPSSVWDELRVRAAYPRADVPPELPGRALGIVGSDLWNCARLGTTEDEDREVKMLQERIGGIGSTGNAGECEAAVLIARRAPTAVMATDDRSALPVLSRFVLTTAAQHLRYVHTTTVLDELRTAGRIDDEQANSIRARLHAKGRPLL